MKKFKKIFVVSCAIVMALTFTGCTKKEVYTIEPHETAFLISLSEGGGKQASFESEAMLAEAKVAAKQVYITYSKRHLSPTDIIGTWVPDNMLVVVNRTPVTREWSEGKDSGTSTVNQSISAESKESIGFSVGMNCSAQIYTENDANPPLFRTQPAPHIPTTTSSSPRLWILKSVLVLKLTLLKCAPSTP